MNEDKEYRMESCGYCGQPVRGPRLVKFSPEHLRGWQHTQGKLNRLNNLDTAIRAFCLFIGASIAIWAGMAFYSNSLLDHISKDGKAFLGFGIFGLILYLFMLAPWPLCNKITRLQKLQDALLDLYGVTKDKWKRHERYEIVEQQTN